MRLNAAPGDVSCICWLNNAEAADSAMDGGENEGEGALLAVGSRAGQLQLVVVSSRDARNHRTRAVRLAHEVRRRFAHGFHRQRLMEPAGTARGQRRAYPAVVQHVTVGTRKR